MDKRTGRIQTHTEVQTIQKERICSDKRNSLKQTGRYRYSWNIIESGSTHYNPNSVKKLARRLDKSINKCFQFIFSPIGYIFHMVHVKFYMFYTGTERWWSYNINIFICYWFHSKQYSYCTYFFVLLVDRPCSALGQSVYMIHFILFLYFFHSSICTYI